MWPVSVSRVAGSGQQRPAGKCNEGYAATVTIFH